MQSWARKRQGPDGDHFRLNSGRIYILPNAQGVAFAFLLLAMLIGAMNYNNSLGLAVTFLMTGVGLVAMHHCQRNLSGLLLQYGGDKPTFVGQKAQFRVTLINDSSSPRFGLTLKRDDEVSETVHLQAGEHATLCIEVDATKRGYLELDRFRLYTTFPLGLFHCWAWIHPQWRTVVYPRPASPGLAPPLESSDAGGSHDATTGDADFAGLRNYRDGDSPRHIAWKAFARGQELLVKQYSGTDVSSHWFDFSALSQMNLEARLSQLSRWIVDADLQGNSWGLRLPGKTIEPDLGPTHRNRCLTALALL
ncbi:MAG: DUF58 domain-containing protein [Gammaproteobacteria bacterium]|nr:DUF58 domain-containing protein [Gammaproteobacteria bacterium]